MEINQKMRIALACFGAIMSTSAQANGNAVVDGYISSIHLENGDAYVSFISAVGNPDNCGSAGAVVLPAGISSHDSYISLLMTAMATGKRVSAWVDGCNPSPFGSTFPALYAMQVKP